MPPKVKREGPGQGGNQGKSKVAKLATVSPPNAAVVFAPDSWGEKLQQIYAVKCPERSHAIPKLLSQFVGREDELLKRVTKKYSADVDMTEKSVSAVVVEKKPLSKFSKPRSGGPPKIYYTGASHGGSTHFTSQTFEQQAASIPVRLSEQERRYLALLTSALKVSDYTDKIDTYSSRNKAQRIEEELNKLFATISGLMVAEKFEVGQRLVKGRRLSDNGELLSQIFEVGRRYKVMNPDRMRADFGKLMYLLQVGHSLGVTQSLGVTHLGAGVTVMFPYCKRGRVSAD
jgi:hypothetical protein